MWHSGVVPPSGPIRIAVVLSAGGLRGAGHVGVLRQLVRHGVPIDTIVGVSAGAVVGAYYAAVGLGLDALIADAGTFRGRHLLTHSLAVRLGPRLERRLAPWCGVIPERLRQLEAASFGRLHHRVRRLVIVCHDVDARCPRYFHDTGAGGVRLHQAVLASASIPGLFPPVTAAVDGVTLRLTDGGVSDPLPLAIARDPAIGATHVIVSDCRWLAPAAPDDERTVSIRPRMATTGMLWSPRRGLLAAVRGGEAAVTAGMIDRIRGWLREDDVATLDRASAAAAR